MTSGHVGRPGGTNYLHSTQWRRRSAVNRSRPLGCASLRLPGKGLQPKRGPIENGRFRTPLIVDTWRSCEGIYSR